MFVLEDGTQIKLSSVVAVTPVYSGQYNIIFSGGHHETIKETFKLRSEFIPLWEAA